MSGTVGSPEMEPNTKPFMVQMELRPLEVLRQSRSGFPSRLKSPRRIGMMTVATAPQGSRSAVTVTCSVTKPVARGVNVMLRTFVAVVIVAPVAVQAYVAPTPASGTDAAAPATRGRTVAGAVMMSGGGGGQMTEKG